MARSAFIGLLMLASTAWLCAPALAAEPSLHQVYQAAEAGKLGAAQTMMQEVLSAHPNSAKAHFVEAELLVKQGQLKKAEAELATAERLAPGLPFATPQAVQNLRAQLGLPGAARAHQAPPLPALQQPAQEAPRPWGMVLIGLGLIAFIVFAARLMSRRNALPVSGAGQAPGSAFGSGYNGAPMQPYGAGGMGAAASPGSGMGSQIIGGLATGAAVGVGVAAGEALMHRFLDGKGQQANSPNASPLANELSPALDDPRLDDLGGSDFGVSDAGSWDDGSSADSDWN